jgi:seryl-tRNA synthetase
MIDHKELRLWLQGQINKCREKDYNHWQNAKAEAFGQVIAHIDRERAKLQQAHERIDRARKSNAKPVEKTFVFPLTVEGNAEWDAQKKLHEAANEIKESRVKVKVSPDRSCLPCRSDETDGESDPLGDLNKMPVGEFYARLAASQEKTRQFLANVHRSLPTDNPEGC